MTRPTDPERLRLLRLLHLGRRQLGLSEADYRALLQDRTGQASAAALDPAGLRALLAALAELGFVPRAPGTNRLSSRPAIRLIFGLWTELGRKGLLENASRPALFAFVKRMSGVDHPDWLEPAAAQAVIEALKAMRVRGKGSGAGDVTSTSSSSYGSSRIPRWSGTGTNPPKSTNE